MAVPTHVEVQPKFGAAAAVSGDDPRSRRAASVSIVLPAHDEARTLPACLRSLLMQDYAGSMRVIIIDNGSRDGTADVARRWVQAFASAGHELIVLHLEQGNKCAALNAGDAMACGAVRIYLDADTELSPNCVSRVAATLTDGSGIEMCCPRMRIAPARSWVTRRYARVWSRLPWVADDAIGGGFYAVSAAGRRRWGKFPDLLSEDSFAQAQFRRHERRVLPDATFLVRLPEGFGDLVKVRTRWISGNRQLARQISGEWGRAAFPMGRRIRALLARPGLWLDLPLYVLVNNLSLWRATRRESLGTSIWERARPLAGDDSLEESEPAAWPPGL